MRWVLPPGSEGYGYQLGKIVKFEVQGKTLLGWDRMQWSEIHFWLAAAFVAVIVIHFLISWSRSESKA
jgi:cytochrome b561